MATAIGTLTVDDRVLDATLSVEENITSLQSKRRTIDMRTIALQDSPGNWCVVKG